MSRVVSRARPRAGVGLGERISEIAVFVAILVVLVMAGRWYFFVHLRSPSTALGRYLGAINAGDVETQFNLLAASTKQQVGGSAKAYRKSWPLAQKLAARLSNITIKKVTERGNVATAEVSITIRKTGQALYQAGADTYQDRYVMTKEADGWKVVLEKSDVKSAAAVETAR